MYLSLHHDIRLQDMPSKSLEVNLICTEVGHSSIHTFRLTSFLIFAISISCSVNKDAIANIRKLFHIGNNISISSSVNKDAI